MPPAPQELIAALIAGESSVPELLAEAGVHCALFAIAKVLSGVCSTGDGAAAVRAVKRPIVRIEQNNFEEAILWNR